MVISQVIDPDLESSLNVVRDAYRAYTCQITQSWYRLLVGEVGYIFTAVGCVVVLGYSETRVSKNWNWESIDTERPFLHSFPIRSIPPPFALFLPFQQLIIALPHTSLLFSLSFRFLTWLWHYKLQPKLIHYLNRFIASRLEVCFSATLDFH